MAARSPKICKACHKSFEPQLSDAEMRDLWFSEEEMERDREHADTMGHSHLEEPPYQDLCLPCSQDPDVEAILPGPFGGPVVYRKKSEAKPLKRIKVQDVGAQVQHKVKASDGTEMTITGGPLPPPQEIVDIMREAEKGFEQVLNRNVPKVQPKTKPMEIIKGKDKRPWWAFWKKHD